MGKGSEKVFVCGVDAMDPRLTRRYIDMGLMPNAKKLLENGAAREDLVMLGCMPTVTPPQWTTMACGCTPQVHGITSFYRLGGDLDRINMNLDSRLCKAEQIWNVTAEAGKKTLVWHWPGSAWPPSSDSENLLVVDGSSPGSVNMSTAQIDGEFIFIASEETERVAYRTRAGNGSYLPEVLKGKEALPDDVSSGSAWGGTFNAGDLEKNPGWTQYTTSPTNRGQGAYIMWPIDIGYSPIQPAGNDWAEAPAGAKEFTLVLSCNKIQRPALILKNEAGIYDRVAIYKSKSDVEPLCEIANDTYYRDYMDEAVKGDTLVPSNRDMRVLEIAEDGSKVRMWVSASMDATVDIMFHPRDLYQEILDNVGFPPPTATLGGGNPELLIKCANECWEHTMEWQAACLLYMMEQQGVEVAFSHFHAPDLQDHMFIRFMGKGHQDWTPDDYEIVMQAVYTQVDRYIGKFLPLMDQGWTIMVVSDHAQVCPAHGIRGLGDMGMTTPLMEELGFLKLVTDENGKKLDQVDWANTKAVANREMHIYLNLKGRTDHGIIEPEDQYQVEEEIITALYGHKDPVTGQRIIAFALRRKDAVMLGLGAPYPTGGDIIYCMAEGYEHDHDDSMPTSLGEGGTSVSPIFMAGGAGLKHNIYTDRMIRQQDVAPTIATLLGVRMPAQCEGAPVYQILAD